MVAIVRRIFERPAITSREILAAVAAYLEIALVFSFLYGGLLLTYSESPQPFHWRRFLWGAWHWFGANLLLGISLFHPTPHQDRS